MTYLLLIGSLSLAQNNSFERGNEAYANEDYETAIQAYETVIAKGFMSSDLFYNTGNAYYRNGEIGKAIWAYEKALEVDPSNKNARENLDFVKMQTVDKIDNSAPGIGTWLRGLLFGPSINLWAYTSIGCSLLFAISLIIFFRSSGRKRKNLGLLMGALSGALLLLTSITAHQHKTFISERDEGIVISREAKVKISPIEKASVSFTLHEGAKVKLTGTNENWIHIELNGNSGWLPKDDIWEI